MVTQRIVFSALLMFYLCVVVKERAESNRRNKLTPAIYFGKIILQIKW
jgi:hypothetical protein